ncbi:MAG: hypothetical protein AAGJ53_02915, partial [Pseudomonadota bacterium]
MTAIPQLCLSLANGDVETDRLAALLDAVPIASVRLPASCGALVAVVQAGGAAALIDDDAEAAKRMAADGVHLTLEQADLDIAVPDADDDAPSPAVVRLQSARAVVGEDAIVGADAGVTRHLAMELAEAGADYVAFASGDGVEARDAFAEHVGWWAALFEVPCVARCSSVEDIDAVAPARPEFIELAWPSLAS